MGGWAAERQAEAQAEGVAQAKTGDGQSHHAAQCPATGNTSTGPRGLGGLWGVPTWGNHSMAKTGHQPSWWVPQLPGILSLHLGLPALGVVFTIPLSPGPAAHAEGDGPVASWPAVSQEFVP